MAWEHGFLEPPIFFKIATPWRVEENAKQSYKIILIEVCAMVHSPPGYKYAN